MSSQLLLLFSQSKNLKIIIQSKNKLQFLIWYLLINPIQQIHLLKDKASVGRTLSR